MAITSKLTTLAQLQMVAERINTVLGDYAKDGDLGALAKKNEVALDDLATALKELIEGKQDATQVSTAIQTAITALSVETAGTGNAVTGLAYDSATGKFTVTKGSTFLTAAEMENTINSATATDAEVTAMLTEVFGA